MAYYRNRHIIALAASALVVLAAILAKDTRVLLSSFLLVPLMTVGWDICVEPLKWHEGKLPYEGENNTTTLGLDLRYKAPGDAPPPYPNGWFMLLLSHDIGRGEVKTVQFMGQDVVAWRGAEDGVVHVIDAYCTHLGAHLGEGGTVVGDCIRCPFHAWEFGGDGACTKVPYAEGVIPKNSGIKSWKTVETNNMILIHFHAEGEEPTWFPVDLPDINSGVFKYHGRSEHIMRCHIQEIPENGPDFVHLNFVHTTISHVDVPGLSHAWEGSWAPDSHDPHIAHVRVAHKLSFLGWDIEIFHRPVIIRQVGPGLVWLELDSIFGKWIVTQAVTPVGVGKTRLHHSMYSNMNRLFSKFVFYGTVFQVEQDIPIWNNKTFKKKAILLKADGPIAKFRRWYSQFYSASSDTVWREKEVTW